MRTVFKINKLPFLLAVLYGVPLLMISIMCASMALDRPQVLVWKTTVNYPGTTVIKKAGDGLYTATQYVSTSNATEWRIWGWAILPPLVLLAIGLLASFVRRGAYLVTLGAIVVTFGVTHRLDTWVKHHTARYPYGYDNIPDNTNKPGLQSTYDTGQWEHSARSAVISIRQWLIVGACAALVLMVAGELRRRRGRQWVDTQPAASDRLDPVPGTPPV